MRKPDIYKKLNNGRQFLAWILNDDSKIVEIRSPVIVDGLITNVEIERYHENRKIAVLEMENLLNKE